MIRRFFLFYDNSCSCVFQDGSMLYICKNGDKCLYFHGTEEDEASTVPKKTFTFLTPFVAQHAVPEGKLGLTLKQKLFILVDFYNSHVDTPYCCESVFISSSPPSLISNLLKPPPSTPSVLQIQWKFDQNFVSFLAGGSIKVLSEDGYACLVLSGNASSFSISFPVEVHPLLENSVEYGNLSKNFLIPPKSALKPQNVKYEFLTQYYSIFSFPARWRYPLMIASFFHHKKFPDFPVIFPFSELLAIQASNSNKNQVSEQTITEAPKTQKPFQFETVEEVIHSPVTRAFLEKLQQLSNISPETNENSSIFTKSILDSFDLNSPFFKGTSSSNTNLESMLLKMEVTPTTAFTIINQGSSNGNFHLESSTNVEIQLLSLGALILFDYDQDFLKFFTFDGESPIQFLFRLNNLPVSSERNVFLMAKNQNSGRTFVKTSINLENYILNSTKLRLDFLGYCEKFQITKEFSKLKSNYKKVLPFDILEEKKEVSKGKKTLEFSETYSSELVFESNLNKIGNFKLFKDGRIRAIFEDRMSLEMESFEEYAKIITPNGEEMKIRIKDCVINEFAGYIKHVREFRRWALLSDEERLEEIEILKKKQSLLESARIQVKITQKKLEIYDIMKNKTYANLGQQHSG